MYSKLFLIFAVITVIFAAPQRDEDECDTKCNLPNCLCSRTSVPKGLDPKTIPQMVLLTFDDAVQIPNYNFYQDALFDKKNPDGCPIAATYFLSHEYTDYTLVHKLYQKGHEIALHSITHHPLTDYWREANVTQLKEEFGGMRDIAEKFANIPKEHFYGMRIPFLQMSGDNSTKAAKELGLEYDCSWPTQTYINPGLWSYTLDYPSMQDCPVGPCPKSGQPGVWIQPMIDLHDNSGIPCAMADACADVPKDVDGLYKFMMDNFNIQYQGNRAPFGFYVHAGWFMAEENHFKAYKKFVNQLNSMKDVYIISIHQALEWVKNPNTLENLAHTWPSCVKPTQTACDETSCKLKKGEEERYMKICNATCPTNYPWLGNPLGL